MPEELQRIADEYRRRDAQQRDASSEALDPQYLRHLHGIELAIAEALRRTATQLAGARVLDVGTGSGKLAHRLLELGAGEVVGVDLMPDRIALARQSYPAVRFEQGSATELPFEDESFDVVSQFTCLSSILDEAVRRTVAAEIWRVLRPGGAVLSYDLRPSPTPVQALGRLMRRRAGSPAWTPVTPLDLDELRRLFPGSPFAAIATSLNYALPAALRRPRVTAFLLESVRPLRSHYTVAARKPLRAATRSSSAA